MRYSLQRSLSFICLLALVSCGVLPSTSETREPGSTDWYTLYFTHPGEAGTGLSVESALVESIRSADDRIDLALYSFSLGTIADALIAAQLRGVEVRMVMEADNMDSYQVKRLLAAGIPIRGDNTDGLMHNKFVIIDDREVWAGSMNLTITSAQEDANNLICIRSRGAGCRLYGRIRCHVHPPAFRPVTCTADPLPIVLTGCCGTWRFIFRQMIRPLTAWSN